MSRNTDNFYEKHKMKKLLRNLLLPISFTSAFCGYAPKMVAVPIISIIIIMIISNNAIASKGRLDIISSSQIQSGIVKLIHSIKPDASEGMDYWDSIYFGMFSPDGIKAKIVSIVEEKELEADVRPEDSTSSINLELSLHSQSGGPITLNSTNELWCYLPLVGSGYDFGKKPITLWKRGIIDSNENPNDPNNYTLSFMADVREAMEKNAGVIPLPDLNGTYGSEVPYMYAQIRFDVYPGNLNFGLDADGKVLDGIVDMKDLAILGNDWGKQGQPLEFVGDITGPQGLPDGKVDYQDLELLTRYWLKDIREIMPSP